MKLLIILLIISAPYVLSAQQQNISLQKLKWSSLRSVILNSNYSLESTCEVTSDPAASRISIKNGERNSEFIIVQQEGSWPDVQQAGRVIFTVTFGEDPGVITFEKNTDETFIEVDMSVNPSGVKRKIIVHQISTE
jgi:hypothetical protein